MPSSRAAASIPASAKPFTSGAGQVNGTFTIPTRRPAAERRVQSAGARLWLPFTSRRP